MELSNERLVVGLGDSVTAGDGLRGPEETVTARLAERLDAAWAVRARSGLTSRGITRLLDRRVGADDVAAADVVVVSAGVNDLLRLKLIDEIVAEPVGGAHVDPDATGEALREALIRHVTELRKLRPEKLVRRRAEKYAAMGVYSEA